MCLFQNNVCHEGKSHVLCTVPFTYLGGQLCWGAEMDWYCLPYLLAAFCNQKVHHSFMSILGHTFGLVHPGASVQGSERSVSAGCNYNGFI